MSLIGQIFQNRPIEPPGHLKQLIADKADIHRKYAELSTVNDTLQLTIRALQDRVAELERNDKNQMEEIMRLRKLEAFRTMK